MIIQVKNLSKNFGQVAAVKNVSFNIARGLLHQPVVLFLDEPTFGLDP